MDEEKGPKPVTVEDEPETPDFAQSKPEAPLISTASSVVAVNPPYVAPVSQLRTQLRNAVESLSQENMEMEHNIEKLEASMTAQRLSSPSPAPQDSNSIQVTIGPSSSSLRTKFSAASISSPTVSISRTNFAVCCNSCDSTIPDAHYHCSKCDEGDFDLCQTCVDQGITCHGSDHWLIKRFVKGNEIITSTTETLAPKPKAKPVEPFITGSYLRPGPTLRFLPLRTCNSCVQELGEDDFLHCTVCEDFDLCQSCFAKDQHGHHPSHGFAPAVEGTQFSHEVTKRLAPGRSHRHNAICDGCEKFIYGVRHKCLDCPDWDYCGDCVSNAGFIHPDHRFVPIYEQTKGVSVRCATRPVHYGICCDGPLCASGRNSYIVGERYKCAVCHDTDFCANCEASPANTHNKTHPLIKFKSPVRHVSVTTTGEREDGKRMPAMGDRERAIKEHMCKRHSTSSRATETTLASPSIAATTVQTVVDVKPTEVEVEEKEVKQEEVKPEVPSPVVHAPKTAHTAADLVAVFERDTIADGTVLPPNHVFEQTWVLRNAGTVPWPAGCAVKFASGEYMGHIDSRHPAGIHELVSASESTVCYNTLAPGQEFPFTVLLRTPAREGKFTSYWRLTTKNGMKFGHQVWCEVEVKTPEAKAAITVPVVEEDKTDDMSRSSQMIFPKLETESPVSSIHEEVKSEAGVVDEDFEDCSVEDGWAEDSDDGFMTDEEYDILDASDEEYVGEHQKKLQK